MQRAVRSSVTSGVALLGAGVIAASPIAPPVSDIHLPAIHMDASLAAAVGPIDFYKQVFDTARTNLQALVDAADPGAVLKQIVANQTASFTALGSALGTSGNELITALTKTAPEQLQTILTSLASGNVEAATNALLFLPLAVAQPLINLLPAIQAFMTQPIQNLINVAHIFNDPVGDAMIAVGLLSPVIGGLAATGTAVQNVIDASRTGDAQKIANAIVEGPATIIDGILNGGYGPDLGPLVGGGISVLAGGLLSQSTIVFNPDGSFFIKLGGPIGTLQTLATQIVNAIKPAAVKTAAVKAKALPAATTTTEASTTETSATTDTPAKSTEAPKAAAKPVHHSASATPAKDGNDSKGDSAGGPKHQHKAEGRGHSAR
ncbi:hypothetical protein FHT40_002968 [Mycolicibacterium sp. BK556]|uniref:hypothetical protein n=1 Tax=unclassified Mycolicibacterium TaxID=2636767 RepID=UPI001615292A|nr:MULTISPECIES: hypothetical protein [unclassified Mycolicibacterium]MBB3603307.1 hypothetical protein [Mycolicibacterium sp. BK556]MBB3633502.1 hypothetical protein [Mycolicibacterium sp. BK607]